MKKAFVAAAVASVSLLGVLAFVPDGAHAQQPSAFTEGGDPVRTVQGDTVRVGPAPVVSNCEETLCNPLKGVDSIGGLIFKVINFVYSLSYAVIAFFLIWSGFKFVTAQGSEDKLTDAKNTFKGTIIGAILLIGANVITQVIKNLIDTFR